MAERDDSNDQGDGDEPKKPQKTGYRQPPPEHQFPPGHSGNPRGRPRGAKGLRSELLRALNQRVPVTIGGKRKQVNRLLYFIEDIVRQGLEEKDLRVKIQFLQALVPFIGMEDLGSKKAQALSASDQRTLDLLMKNLAPPEEDTLSPDDADDVGDGSRFPDDDNPPHAQTDEEKE